MNGRNVYSKRIQIRASESLYPKLAPPAVWRWYFRHTHKKNRSVLHNWNSIFFLIIGQKRRDAEALQCTSLFEWTLQWLVVTAQLACIKPHTYFTNDGEEGGRNKDSTIVDAVSPSAVTSSFIKISLKRPLKCIKWFFFNVKVFVVAISLEPDIETPHMAFPTVHVDMVKGLATPKGLFFFSDNTLARILQLKKKNKKKPKWTALVQHTEYNKSETPWSFSSLKKNPSQTCE